MLRILLHQKLDMADSLRNPKPQSHSFIVARSSLVSAKMSMHKHRLGSARFGVTTFFAYTHPSDQVGPDGLPVTPSAVRILGRFSLLKELNHKNLTAYIDIARLKNGMINLCSSLYKCGGFSRPSSCSH